MGFSERVRLCAAVMVVGGILSSGLASWSPQTVFLGSALWLVFGVLGAVSGVGALAVGRLYRAARRVSPGAATAEGLPYAQEGSPASRLARALHLAQDQRGDAQPARELLIFAGSLAATLMLAQLFTRQAPAIMRLSLGVALFIGALSASESSVVLVLGLGAWCASAAAMGPLQTQQLSMGGLAALLLCAASDGRGDGLWQKTQVISGIGLGLGLALAQQPALAGLVWVAALATVGAKRGAAPGAIQRLTAGISVLLAGLAVGHWN